MYPIVDKRDINVVENSRSSIIKYVIRLLNDGTTAPASIEYNKGRNIPGFVIAPHKFLNRFLILAQLIPSRYASSLSEIDAMMIQKGHIEIIPITIYGCKYSKAIPPAGAPIAPPTDKVNQQND